MPRKTIKMALSNTLEDLSKQDLDKFCHRLLDRRDEPRVRRSRVEGKNFLEIVDVLVSTFTESRGRDVAVEILREIGCREEAEELGEGRVTFLPKGERSEHKQKTPMLICLSKSRATCRALGSVKVETRTSAISHRLFPSTALRRTRGSSLRSLSRSQNFRQSSSFRSSKTSAIARLIVVRAICQLEMAPKTKKAALADMLENLSKSNFEKFCRKLLDRREEPRVRRRQVEEKNFLDIADVLVSTFTEAGAVKVAVELLEDVNCGDEAEELVQVTAGLDSKPGTSATARPSAGATGVDTTSGDKHFVDKHKVQLIDRVSNVDPILDQLLERGVIQQESYDTIRALPTTQKKMRELFSGCLKAGAASKDIFYEILQEYEKFLINDLKTNY
ncbi:uncharacterized protein LKV04_007505 [Tautogolabrus adspersus]